MRHVFFALRESVSSFTGKSDPLVPPRRLIDGVGGGDFKKVGEEFFGHFTTVGELKPEHRVLDVGCGCGRMAVPMIPYLTGAGEYRGFDIVPDAIEWSQQNITAKYPNFHFELADIYHQLYNPKGKSPASEYRFPYEDNYFDFTFLTSVFTHMFAKDMRNYLAEITRTLKPGGRCMINYFVLNSESRENMGKGITTFSFKYPLENCFTTHKKKPEAAIAYEENFIRKCFADNGLKIQEPIRYGSWSGRKDTLSFQDVVVAVKA